MKRLMLVELVGPEAGFSVTLGFHVGPGGSSSVKVDNGPEGRVQARIARSAPRKPAGSRWNMTCSNGSPDR